MFKKLKDKIAEEVKSSPSRIQQFAQAAQAAVSSTSSQVSDTPSGSENFFSITEEDTPQNSPQRTRPHPTPSVALAASNTAAGGPATSVLNNGNQSTSAYRTRKLSNSSMASDVSFRLPAFDSPAVYHLQSDMESASEFEDSHLGSQSSTNPAHLDLISKEQLHQAYKKALERYQKYHNRYTDVAKRYRELERDNNKARSVLVETQDKALRRISELREQCSLEQQAKAHLESALRLEMDEMQCVIKTLTTKLSVMGANPDDVLAAAQNKDNLIQLENPVEQPEPRMDNVSLINFTLDDTEQNGNNNLDSPGTDVNKIIAKLDDANKKIGEMKAREEENTILLAENKMMIHSELENKEAEVRGLEKKLSALEETLKANSVDKMKLQELVTHAKKENSSLHERIAEAIENNKKLEQRIAGLDKTITAKESAKKELEAKLIIVDSEKESIQTKINLELQKFKTEYNDLLRKKEELEGISDQKLLDLRQKLEAELKHIKEAHADVTKQLADIQLVKVTLESTIAEQKNRITQLVTQTDNTKSQMDLAISDKAKLEQRLKQLFDEKQHIITEFEVVKSQNSTHKSEVDKLQSRIASLEKEVSAKNETICNSEPDALTTLQETMSISIAAFEQKLQTSTDELIAKTDEIRKLEMKINDVEHEKSEAINTLHASTAESEEKLNLISSELTEKSEEICSLKQKITNIDREKSDSASDVQSLRSKIDSLKTEKRDLEKTLEKEIRDKAELKTQVTNILQEIGRLEEQLTEVKHSYAEIQKEKRALEEKSVEQHHQMLAETKVKIDKDHSHNMQANMRELELKLQEVQCENTQLSEKNCQLVEENGRLQITATEAEISLTSACTRAQELENNLATVRLEIETYKDAVESLKAKLRQCVDENSRLFNEKELLEHEYRSLQDQCDLKDKEKLCVLDTNKCLEADMVKLRQVSDSQEALEREKNNLAETCDRMHGDLDVLQSENAELKRIREDLDAKLADLAVEVASARESHAAIQRELEVSRQNHSEANKTLVDDCEAMLDEVQKLRKENQQYLSELTVATKERNVVEKRLESEVNELKNLNQQYLSHLKEATDESQMLKKELVKSSDAVKKLNSLEQVKIENEYLNTSLKQLQADVDRIGQDKVKFEQQCLEANTKLQSQQCELYVLQEEQVKRKDAERSKDIEIDQLKAVCLRSQTLNEEFQNELRQTKDQCDTLRSLSEELQASQSMSETQIQSLKSKVSHAEQLNETYQNELRKQKQFHEEQLTSHQKSTAEHERLSGELRLAQEKLLLTEEKAIGLTKEIESSRAIISDLNKDLEQQIELVQTAEAFKESLESKVNVMQEQALANKGTASKTEELEQLRRINESLKLELAEKQRITDGKITNLNNEIDELNENARAYKEKSSEVEVIKQNMTVLQGELNEYKRGVATAVTNGSDVNEKSVEVLKQERNELDLKLKKIMHEVQDVSNRNLFLEQQCENYLIVEQSNERLKLQNDKLSRQLDETLVSLQHTEGCGANTEFEYLKNIMFQYLTNNINSNGSTLVKVIAAVLKFSPQQTQVVLERESHRRTLVGQLNNLL